MMMMIMMELLRALKSPKADYPLQAKGYENPQLHSRLEAYRAHLHGQREGGLEAISAVGILLVRLNACVLTADFVRGPN